MTVKLPVVGSHVTRTVFCAVNIPITPEISLWIDGNSKITRTNGDYANPQPNAFSLPAGNTDERRAAGHCPGSTPACRSSCYVAGLEAFAGDTYALYAQNHAALRTILADHVLSLVAAKKLGEWISENARGGFRWHVSGDVESLDHAEWIADVCRCSPDVMHWIYTRSLDFLEPLVSVSTTLGGNLAINISCDRDNYAEARDAAHYMHNVPIEDEYGNVIGYGWYRREKPIRLAYLTVDGNVPADLPKGSVVFPDYPYRERDGVEPGWFAALPKEQKKMTCPVDLKGKSEIRRCGPCAMCLS